MTILDSTMTGSDGCEAWCSAHHVRADGSVIHDSDFIRRGPFAVALVKEPSGVVSITAEDELGEPIYIDSADELRHLWTAVGIAAALAGWG